MIDAGLTAAVAAAAGGALLGAAGSGHCAAMCGPLVMLANPRGDGATASASTGRLVTHTLLYHAGRTITYATLGLALGLTGGAMASAGIGRWLAIAASAALIVQAVASWRAFRSSGRHPLAGAVTRAIGRAGTYMRRHRVAGPMVFGGLTGLLPCGLVYAALTAALGLAHGIESTAFMAGFGLGTTPVLAALGLSAGQFERWWPASGVFPRLRQAAPLALTAIAVLLTLRAFGHQHTAGAPASPAAPSTHQHSR